MVYKEAPTQIIDYRLCSYTLVEIKKTENVIESNQYKTLFQVTPDSFYIFIKKKLTAMPVKREYK